MLRKLAKYLYYCSNTQYLKFALITIALTAVIAFVISYSIITLYDKFFPL